MAARVVCGWCHEVLIPGPATAPVTHTICARCLAEFKVAVDELTTRAERETLEPLDPRD